MTLPHLICILALATSASLICAVGVRELLRGTVRVVTKAANDV